MYHTCLKTIESFVHLKWLGVFSFQMAIGNSKLSSALWFYTRLSTCACLRLKVCTTNVLLLIYCYTSTRNNSFCMFIINSWVSILVKSIKNVTIDLKKGFPLYRYSILLYTYMYMYVELWTCLGAQTAGSGVTVGTI